MFYIFFGWRKASKCKKQIRIVQSRLKLLKNKRSCIVRQLREDMAILLKHGHQQSAFDRADQLFKDECELTAYELLDNFCEFVIANFSYIRKLKECPNDIHEAVSTLIFSSARFGELPELKKIRELFKDRYGKRFITAALELLPGNLVNQQIMDLRRRCVEVVSDDVKFRLVSEIAGNCLKSGPLLIDYPSQPLHLKEAEDETRNGDIIITDTKAKILDIGNKSGQDGVNIVLCNEVSLSVKSSSEKSQASPEEMVYLDDIAEFVSSVRIEGNIQDQRVFMFSPSNCKAGYVNRESRRRPRKRSISLKRSSMIDAESAIYYGDLYETSNGRKQLKKGSKCKKMEKCSEQEDGLCCIRALSLPPQERLLKKDDDLKGNISRSNSSPVETTCDYYIHPKLPDYDDLAAKFISLKKAHLKCGH